MEAIKRRIVQYWARRAEHFQKQRIREWENEKRVRWLTELERYLPRGRALSVLDVGAGTGFFACLLAAEGHDVTGIDLTPEMVALARESAAALGLNAAFEVMDAESPVFPPERFDAVVTRNLTWSLPHLREAYAAWYGLLKPDGVLVNFDADYCRAVEEGRTAELPDGHAHRGIDPALWAENDAISMELFAHQQPRPQWDVQLLLEAGFERVSVDTGVYRRVYREKDEFYNPTPIFALAAYK